jgi:AcrR family transcriptional regulator
LAARFESRHCVDNPPDGQYIDKLDAPLYSHLMPQSLARPAPSLRDARKAFVRSHICDAARDLFFRQGYTATTFEQIALAAGTRRTTLYSHFADKAEILDAIGRDYHRRLCVLVDELPGPVPTRAEIDRWIGKLVGFVLKERTPATLLIGLGVAHDAPPAVERVSHSFQEALAARLPAFARAALPGPQHDKVRAMARLILRELSLGCLEAAREDPPLAAGELPAILEVVADLFERFVAPQN